MQKCTTAVMIIIGIVQIILWGLPPLFASEQTASFFGLKHAGEFAHWCRFFGMVSIMWGLMLIAAAFKPRENKLLVTFSILLFLFALVLTLAMMYWDMIKTLDPGEWIWWVAIVAAAVFALALIICYQKGEKPAKQPEPAKE
jgi:hypothetical protein